MKLLAIDTAFEACSVAVEPGTGADPVIRSETIGRGHAERLPSMMAEAMKEAGLSFTALDRIAVTIGPGSFTGLRVGVAAARGLALVVKCPVVGITTLAVHAASARGLVGAVPVLAVIDARRGELYGQRFASDGVPFSEPEAADPARFAGLFKPGDVLAGTGSDAVAALLPEMPVIAHRHAAPDISALLALALEASASDSPPGPLYLRPPDAKPQQGKGVARL